VAASDGASGAVSLGKNVMIGGSNRSDVGAKITWQVTMRGDTPVLDAVALINDVDVATGAVHRVIMKGAAPTPVGTSTVVVETTQDGKPYRLSATPTPAAALGAASPSGKHALDVAISHAGGGGPVSKTQLNVVLDGDAPGVAKQHETVPLVVRDGGVATPRQDVGSRVKVVGHPRANGLELDFDLELSAIEGTSPFVVRKIIAHGPVFAPFDQSTTAFTAEEDGHRYEVTVTPHRAN
jgi:hypothetical protein